MNIKPKLATVKNHVIRNRAKYAATTTLAVCVALHRAQVVEMDKFLAEHNLLEKFYNPEEN